MSYFQISTFCFFFELLFAKNNLVSSVNDCNAKYDSHKSVYNWAVVVAQLAEQSLPTPEDPGSNATIGNFYKEHLFAVNCLGKTKMKKRAQRMVDFSTRTLFAMKHIFKNLHGEANKEYCNKKYTTTPLPYLLNLGQKKDHF